MSSIWTQLYREKLVTAQDAVAGIRDGDRVDYAQLTSATYDLDRSLAARARDFKELFVRTSTLQYIPEIFKVDPNGEHFIINEQSFTPSSRKMKQMGSNVHHVPELYHEMGFWYYRKITGIDVMFLSVRPMDKNGYFNLSVIGSTAMDIIKSRGGDAKDFKVIVEVNTSLPFVHGDNNIHISEVAYVTESTENRPLPTIPRVRGDDIDEKIADIIMEQLTDGSCIQLGIGGIPNFVGKKIAKSDLKDLGCHTEMLVDSYVDMFLAGKLTNRRKTVCRDKSLFTFAMGSQELYDFVDGNPGCECRPVSQVNDPAVIAQNDNVISINGCINIDYFGNVSSESVGYKQISGTGGQLDYHFASLKSNGGKGFVCCHSVKQRKDGSKESAIVPCFLPGTQITLPAGLTNYIVTEYGAVNLKAKPVWQRTEDIISIAHPDFREELIRGAEEVGIWRRSNKR